MTIIIPDLSLSVRAILFLLEHRVASAHFVILQLFLNLAILLKVKYKN